MESMKIKKMLEDNESLKERCKKLQEKMDKEGLTKESAGALKRLQKEVEEHCELARRSA